MSSSYAKGFRYPASADTPDLSRDLQNLASDAETYCGMVLLNTIAVNTSSQTSYTLRTSTQTNNKYKHFRIAWVFSSYTAGSVKPYIYMPNNQPSGYTAKRFLTTINSATVASAVENQPMSGQYPIELGQIGYIDFVGWGASDSEYLRPRIAITNSLVDVGTTGITLRLGGAENSSSSAQAMTLNTSDTAAIGTVKVFGYA